MTEILIQKALFKNYHTAKYRFANKYLFENESDFIVINQNGYLNEFEIKISRSDFKADFKKPRHQKLNSINGSKLITKKGSNVILHDIAISNDLLKEYPKLCESRVLERYDYRKNEYFFEVKVNFHKSCGIEFVNNSMQGLPNKLYYVTPKDLITVDEVPKECGLLYVDNNLNVIKVKEAQFIHKDIIDIKKRMFDKIYYPYEKSISDRYNKI